jgi:hypothetical protein
MGGAMGKSEKTPRRSIKKARCVIYTRKSSEEGLEQAFRRGSRNRMQAVLTCESMPPPIWVLRFFA